jgi:hypothetical protein
MSRTPGVGFEPRNSSLKFILLEYKRIEVKRILDCTIVFLNYC